MARLFKIFGVMIFFTNILSLVFSQEQITITTYYPSPYGSYNELQLFPHNEPTTECNAATRGTMYYDSDDDSVYVCKGATLGWQLLSPIGCRYVNYTETSGNCRCGDWDCNGTVDEVGYYLAGVVYHSYVTHPSTSEEESIVPRSGRYLCCRAVAAR